MTQGDPKRKRRDKKSAQELAANPRHRGTPPWIPTKAELDRIEDLAAHGMNLKQIAVVIGRNRNTLAKYVESSQAYKSGVMRRIHDAAKLEQHHKVAKKLVETALGGNVTAMMFYLKTQAGWREAAPANASSTVTNTTNTTIKVDVGVILEGKTEQELAELERALKLLIDNGIVSQPGPVAPVASGGAGTPPRD